MWVRVETRIDSENLHWDLEGCTQGNSQLANALARLLSRIFARLQRFPTTGDMQIAHIFRKG